MDNPIIFLPSARMIFDHGLEMFTNVSLIRLQQPEVGHHPSVKVENINTLNHSQAVQGRSSFTCELLSLLHSLCLSLFSIFTSHCFSLPVCASGTVDSRPSSVITLCLCCLAIANTFHSLLPPSHTNSPHCLALFLSFSLCWRTAQRSNYCSSLLCNNDL